MEREEEARQKGRERKRGGGIEVKGQRGRERKRKVP